MSLCYAQFISYSWTLLAAELLQAVKAHCYYAHYAIYSFISFIKAHGPCWLLKPDILHQFFSSNAKWTSSNTGVNHNVCHWTIFCWSSTRCPLQPFLASSSSQVVHLSSCRSAHIQSALIKTPNLCFLLLSPRKIIKFARKKINKYSWGNSDFSWVKIILNWWINIFFCYRRHSSDIM